MLSATDRIVREVHSRLTEEFADAGQAEILDHLAWEVGGAASELVRPARWVGSALVASGICANRSEAQARIARIVSDHASTLDVAVHTIGSALPGHIQPGTTLMVDHIAAALQSTTCERARHDAVSRMEREIAGIALPIHARLESCTLDELDQAARTMLSLAVEHGTPDVVEDVVVSLLIFSEDWGDGRWWDRDQTEGA